MCVGVGVYVRVSFTTFFAICYETRTDLRALVANLELLIASLIRSARRQMRKMDLRLERAETKESEEYGTVQTLYTYFTFIRVLRKRHEGFTFMLLLFTEYRGGEG